MVQILIHIISYFMAIIMSLFPAKPPVETGPTTIDINGVTYKNCFMPDYGPEPKYKFKISAEGIEPFYVASDGRDGAVEGAAVVVVEQCARVRRAVAVIRRTLQPLRVQDE